MTKRKSLPAIFSPTAKEQKREREGGEREGGRGAQQQHITTFSGQPLHGSSLLGATPHGHRRPAPASPAARPLPHSRHHHLRSGHQPFTGAPPTELLPVFLPSHSPTPHGLLHAHHRRRHLPHSSSPVTSQPCASPTCRTHSHVSPSSSARRHHLLSSSDSESDEEGAEELLVKTLEKQLQENPMNYEAHVQYIQNSRKLGHVEKLRQARESMHQHFPLSPKLWQDWTKDEKSLNADSECFKEIEQLFERGVHEYLYVPLWCDFIEFVQDHDPLVSECAPAGVSKMRSLFERALTAAGLHVSEGSKIWEAYREFEQTFFLTLDDSDSEEKEKQVQRIRALFHRQLSVPLLNMRSTLIDYKLWEAEQITACTAIDSILGNSKASSAMAQIIKSKSRLYAAVNRVFNTGANFKEQTMSESRCMQGESLGKFSLSKASRRLRSVMPRKLPTR